MRSPDTIHVSPSAEYIERWNVYVTYTYFGIIPASTKYFGRNLTREEVENLEVPFARIHFHAEDCPQPLRII